MSSRKVPVSPVVRTVASKHSGPILDTTLAVNLHSATRRGLSNYAARLTKIERTPPDPDGPKPPMRLYWTPSRNTLESIAHGADDAVEVVRFMAGRFAEIHSPDLPLPYHVSPVTARLSCN